VQPDVPGVLVAAPCLVSGTVPALRRRNSDVNDIHDSFAREGLVRPRGQRVLGGVCAGLGRRFGIGPWAARLLFVLLLMVVPGSQILIYPVLWILMPAEDVAPARPMSR
jgi:phage shock protein PspC (stress-responsive transcriptional regulator)